MSKPTRPVKRYEITDAPCEMMEWETGEFVLATDYEALEAENAEVRKLLEWHAKRGREKNKRIAELEAELEKCVKLLNGESVSLPMKEGGVWKMTEGTMECSDE